MGARPATEPPTDRDEPAAPGEPLHKLPPRRPPGEPAPSAGQGREVFPARLFDRPATVLLHGHPPPLVKLTLFALAARANPDYHWVEIGNHSEGNESIDPVVLGWVPNDQLFRVDRPERFGLNPDVTELSLSGMVRSDEPPELLANLTDFLRLPEVSQQILGGRSRGGRPGVVAVANAQLVRERFSADLVPSILAVHRNAGFSVFVGCDGTPPLHTTPFDFVFRVEDDGPLPRRWHEATLVCERGVMSGPLRNGRPMRLGEIPLLAEVLSQAQRLS